ncbi:histidinol-phosphate transaminase [Ignatzschineria rhizosphaerae]|uniref:Histidinol-phosphate aminotransferase n=1 Tax=Ignatzschineria rhizosphaerae TaxID=2923279 RepID=A0ABY3X9B3_9GAMM|nr:histidinol-phosphate transaminase [Ignatzschineria rhizosphaerae]UNM97306.1 histidinol-phosphate transaminase [Ignatzschineria rhizosphaerae]
MGQMIAEKLSRKAVQNCEIYVAEKRGTMANEVYLDTNENPYVGPVKFELAVNRYPEPQPSEVIARFAKYVGVDNDEVLATLGGDLAIELLIKAFCEGKKDKLLYCPPTFGMYQVTCDLYEVETVKVPLLSDFSLDVEGIINNLDGVKMVFLCNPNNPTANIMNVVDIERILEATKNRAIVVVDEAYIEFSEAKSFAKRIKEFPHLALVRTLSKAFGLAGVRFGFAVATAPLINVLKRAISPYPLSVPSIAIAEDSLSEAGIAQMLLNRQKLLESKAALVAALKEKPFVETVYPSESNFILVKLQDAKALYEALKSQGIFVRYLSSECLKDCLRISIGLPKEHEQLLKAMTAFYE